MKNDALAPMTVSVSDAARLLGISRPTLYKLVGQRGFPAFRVGGRTLISLDGLRDWVANHANDDCGE